MQELSACGKQEIPIRKILPIVEKPFELITCVFMFGKEALYRSKAQSIFSMFLVFPICLSQTVGFLPTTGKRRNSRDTREL